MPVVTADMMQHLLEHVTDHPWEGWSVTVLGMKVTLMSSGIASMLLVAIGLCAALVPIARRWQRVPRGPAGAIEAMVIFIRDMVAKPALHDRADRYLPYLLTLFVFVLGMNLMGLLPLASLSELLAIPKIGGTPTAILTVCGALAMTTLGAIVIGGMVHQVREYHDRKQWAAWKCVLLAPLLWIKSLSPSLPGKVGIIMLVPLALLELVGVLAKCFSLMVRLFANMMAGHVLLAVLMVFILQALESGLADVALVGPICIAGSVVVDCLELLVAFLQAYIFTFLTAMFLGLYVEPAH